MIGTRKPKTDFNSLNKLFWAVHKAFLKNHRELLDGKLSERCLCGALMYELNKQLEMNGYNDYYADVEFNKVGKKEKRIKLLPDNEGVYKVWILSTQIPQKERINSLFSAREFPYLKLELYC